MNVLSKVNNSQQFFGFSYSLSLSIESELVSSVLSVRLVGKSTFKMTCLVSNETSISAESIKHAVSDLFVGRMLLYVLFF